MLEKWTTRSNSRLLGGQENVPGAPQVCIEEELLTSIHIVRDGGEVDNSLHAMNGAAKVGHVEDVAGKIFVIWIPGLGFEVHGANRMASVHEAFDDPCTDGTSAACDKNVHVKTPGVCLNYLNTNAESRMVYAGFTSKNTLLSSSGDEVGSKVSLPWTAATDEGLHECALSLNSVIEVVGGPFVK